MSKGRCVLCGLEAEASGMGKHLASCISRKVETLRSEWKALRSPMFHIRVTAQDSLYWMDVGMQKDAELYYLDSFLRDVWVECCNHISLFRIGGRTYSSCPDPSFGDRSMEIPAESVLHSGMRFKYEYDMGSTTELFLKVVGEYSWTEVVATPLEHKPCGMSSTEDSVLDEERSGTRLPWAVVLLARNLPPEFKCMGCGKPATKLCQICFDGEGGMFCDDCAEVHSCEEEFFLPIVNSPRMGVCGYTGPEREDEFEYEHYSSYLNL